MKQGEDEMKRYGLITTAIVILALTAVPAFSTGTGEQIVEDEEVVLTYLAASNWIKDYEYELAEAFEAETGITVDFQELPPDQYENVLRLNLTAQEGVDIFGLISGIPSLQRMQPEVNMVDLSNGRQSQRLGSSRGKLRRATRRSQHVVGCQQRHHVQRGDL